MIRTRLPFRQCTAAVTAVTAVDAQRVCRRAPPPSRRSNSSQIVPGAVERSLKRRAVVPRPPLTEDAAMIALERILIPPDVSEPSDVALTYGLELARASRATAIVIHVVKDR